MWFYYNYCFFWNGYILGIVYDMAFNLLETKEQKLFKCYCFKYNYSFRFLHFHY